MKTITLNQINEFLSYSPMVLYGVSSSPHKMGNSIFKELSANGYKIYPMHKTMESFEGNKCYSNLDEIPEKPLAAIICTKNDKTKLILSEIVNFEIKNVWLQQGSANPETIENSSGNFDNLIYGKCIMMFGNQTGIHKFHSRLLKFFGRFPKHHN
jgi:predicted CoA-binding protein